MTALGIGLATLAALVAIGIGWAYAGRQAARERRTRERMERWQYPGEAELDAAGERVQDYIRVLGRDYEERHERLLQERRERGHPQQGLRGVEFGQRKGRVRVMSRFGLSREEHI